MQISYIQSNNSWVSHVHVVSKKGGATVLMNEKNELAYTRIVTGYKVCIDHQRLNTATRKNYLLIPFFDQMVERLDDHD